MSTRSANPGELCTCGRPAVCVFVFESGREVGYCGRSDGGLTTGPCPFCGANQKHVTVWGDPVPCSRYKVLPVAPARGGESLGLCVSCGAGLHLDSVGWPVDDSGSSYCITAGDAHRVADGQGSS